MERDDSAEPNVVDLTAAAASGSSREGAPASPVDARPRTGFRQAVFGEITGRRPAENLPGLGLAAFVMVLAFFFCVGVSAHGTSIYAVLWSANDMRSSKLTWGGNVDPRTLAPLREAGGIGQDEVVDAFHAETLSGDRACALSQKVVLRLEDGIVQRLPVAEIRGVEVLPDSVVLTSTAGRTLTCWFAPDEGGERFARMLGVP